MAKLSVGADSAPNKLYPNKLHPMEVSPEDVPEIYASVCKGDCLEPVIKDGSCLVFSKTQVPSPGDFVGFWLHPDAVDADELPRRVKRLYIGLPDGMTLPYRPHLGSECEPAIVLEQLNPPRLYHVRASRILAVHKVIGEAEIDGEGRATLVRQLIAGRMMRVYPE